MKRRKPLLAAASATALALAWVVLAPGCAQRLVVSRSLASADAVLVLAGSRAYAERTDRAAALYRDGVAPRVLLSDDGQRGGWSPEEQLNPPFVELSRRRLLARGVPAAAIVVLPGTASGTHDEALAAARAAAAARWKALVLVTSPYHTRRALRTFERVFAEQGVHASLGIVAAAIGEPGRPWWLTRRGWSDVGLEYVKSAWYAFALLIPEM